MNPVSRLLNHLTDRTSGIYRKFGSVILLAAGSGSRAKTEGMTKQQMPLLGVPVIARTVSVFEACPFIDEIILVAREDELPLYDAYQLTYGWKKLVSVVPGGETRQESVLNGFQAISDKSELVYIHDGARCLVPPEMIARVGCRLSA